MTTIGIDFGTTNTSAAVWTPQGARIIDMPDGRDSLPSVVAMTAKGPIVGRSALRLFHEDSTYVFRHVKRYLGREFSEQETHSRQMERGPDGKIWWVGPDGLWSGPGLVAEVLKAVLSAAEYSIGERPKKAVLTIPVGFHEPQKLAMAEAAKLAGLEEWEFLPEPVAAVRAFGLEDGGFARVFVYDWGGGTFDAAILHMGKGAVRDRMHGGLADVGGADIDLLIRNFLSRILAEKGHDVSTKPHNLARLSIASEEAKIDLSQHEESNIYLDNFLTITSGPEPGVMSFEHLLTQAELEELSLELVKSTIDECRRVMERAGLKRNEIKHVILVGGQTRMPLVHAAVEEFFGKKPLAGQRPEHVVALGAAWRGAELDGRIMPTTLGAISSATLGIRRDNGMVAVLIPKGTKLPAAKMFDLTTMADGQEVCTIEVCEGEASHHSMNSLVAAWHEPVPEGAAGDVTVPCVLGRDERGQVFLKVRNVQVYPGVPE